MNSTSNLLTPFIAGRPDAVFIMRTSAASLKDRAGFEQAGYRIAQAVFKGAAAAERTALSSIHPVLKPNVVNDHFKDETGNNLESDGVVTDSAFVGGIARFLIESGFGRGTIAEGGNPIEGEDGDYCMEPAFRDRGYRELAGRIGWDLKGLVRKTFAEEDLVWRSLGDQGVVYREIPFVKPLPGDFMINIPTMKTHYLAVISLAGKNLQGTIALPFRHHCLPPEAAEQYPPEITDHLRPGFMKEIYRLCDKHDREGYWRINPHYELYAQRTCDTIIAMRPQPAISIVEGVRGRDGTAFHRGKDYLTNLVIAGVNPVNVDTVTAYLMGQTPRAVVAYLKIAEERGLGTCDPHAVETYLVDEDGGFVPCEQLRDLQVHPFIDVITHLGSLGAS